jgi:hypothetical protein
MQRHYSTVSEREQAEGLAKVLDMMDFRSRRTGLAGGRAQPPEVGGEHGGERAEDSKEAARD